MKEGDAIGRPMVHMQKCMEKMSKNLEKVSLELSEMRKKERTYER